MTTLVIDIPDKSKVKTITSALKLMGASKVEVQEPRKRSFEEAVAECGGVYTVDEVFDELNSRLRKHFHPNA